LSHASTLFTLVYFLGPYLASLNHSTLDPARCSVFLDSCHLHHGDPLLQPLYTCVVACVVRRRRLLRLFWPSFSFLCAGCIFLKCLFLRMLFLWLKNSSSSCCLAQ
jgi:hypothetical protein